MIISKSRHFQESTYDVHRILQLRVRSPHRKVMRHFDAELGHFRNTVTRVPDLDVIVDRFEISQDLPVRLADLDCVLADGVYGSDNHKVARWRFAIQGLDSQPTHLYFSGGPFSLPFLQHYYIEQLIRYKLSQQDCTLVHGCCLAQDGRAILMPGLKHTGKTSIALHFVHRGWQFQADDYTILSARGQTYSYPSCLHFSCHEKEKYPEMWKTVGLRHRLSRVTKKAVYLLTLKYGNLTEALPITELMPNVVIADTAHLQTLVLLSTHTGAQLEGPFPVSPIRAAARILAINQREGSRFWNVLLDYASINGNNSFMHWWDRERQIIERALHHTACYELLVPRQVKDFNTLLPQIGDLVEETTKLRAA